MHITSDEAISLLDNWKMAGTVLRVYLSNSGIVRELQATVIAIRDGFVDLSVGSEEIKIDLKRAEFNGDTKGPDSSDYGAYLVCEYPSGDRYSFYAPRRKPSEGAYHSDGPLC
jgi:hypothetical protein